MSAENLQGNNYRINKINQFLEQSPNDCFLLHALALEYQKLGDLDKSQFLFEKVLQINEKYIGSYYHLGKILQQQNELINAKNIFLKGIAIAKTINDKHSLQELQNALEI